MTIDGNWKVNLQTPMGAQERALTLSTANGGLSGTMAGPNGDIAIEDATLDGDSVSWSIMAPQLGAKVAFSGTASGDSISGQAGLGGFGSVPFIATRA